MTYKQLNIPRIATEKLHALLTEKQFLIFSSIIVGISAGLAAVILKSFVHAIHNLLFNTPGISNLYLLLPLIGIAVVLFVVKPVFKQPVNAGSFNILHCIAKKGSFLPFEQIYSYVITSGITIGFGGSAGLESPIVGTGAAIGSNFSRIHKLSYKERTLLLAAGAAGGISGAFNAPIAGVLFALEVILVDISITAFIPLLIASVSGSLISTIILNENALLNFKDLTPFDYRNVPYYIVLGLLAGVLSIYYVNIFQRLEHFFEKINSRFRKLIIGGLMLTCLLYFFPSLFGEGYESIKELTLPSVTGIFKGGPLYIVSYSDWALLLLLAAIMFLKVVAASVTIGAGGVGGNFAPSLFMGAYLGFVFVFALRLAGISLPVSNFTMVAMAGILSGVFHAPLTGIFLIAEISGGYALIVPLMIVASISYMVVKFFHPESMDVKKLNKTGTIISENKDIHILGRIEITPLIESDFAVLRPNDSLENVIEHIKHTRRNMFPVVDDNEKLIGIVQLDNIREEMFNTDLHKKLFAKDIMEKPSAQISTDETIFSIMKKFETTGQWNLPVLSKGSYRGFLSKSTILSKYRNELIDSFN